MDLFVKLVQKKESLNKIRKILTDKNILNYQHQRHLSTIVRSAKRQQKYFSKE